MLTPERAREISIGNEGEEDYFTQEANEMVLWAAKKGRRDVHITMPPQTAKKLRQMGYKVWGFAGAYHVRW